MRSYVCGNQRDNTEITDFQKGIANNGVEALEKNVQTLLQLCKRRLCSLEQNFPFLLQAFIICNE